MNKLPLIIGAIALVVVAGVVWVSKMSSTSDVSQVEMASQDSIAAGGIFRAALGSSSQPYAAQATVAQPSETIHRYANAVAQGSMDSLVAAAPGLTPEQKA
ncbi:MAG: hypothetical protein JWM95_5408, partial [Gemmatimonadetes bacterium]|nr:hypothetical protein [Gemmatimonadota bacterium]